MKTLHMSLARKKNNRASFLSSLMKSLSGDLGDEAAKAYADQDKEKMASVFKQVFQQVTKGM